MDEIWRQIIIGLSGIGLALAGSIPVFIKRAQEKRTMEDLQALARRALDVAGDALAILDRQLIIESDADMRIKSQADALHREYDEIWAEYRGRPRVVPTDAPTQPTKT